MREDKVKEGPFSESMSETTFRRLLTRMPAIVCELAPDGTTLTVNEAVSSVTGYRPDELIGRIWWDVLYPDEQRRQVDELYQRFLSGDATAHEMVLVAKDGSPKTLVWTSANQYLPDGTLERIVAYGVDITELKRAEEEQAQLAREQAARAEAELARLRIAAILESITDAFFALDEEWQFTSVNKEAERILQRKREELLGKNIWDMFPDAVDSAFYTECHKAVSERVPVAFEEYYRPLETWAEVHAYPSPEALLVYFRDITKRKRAEEALRDSEERYRALADAAQDMVFIVGRDFHVQYVNASAAGQFESRPEEIIGKPLEKLFPPDVSSRLKISLGEVLETRNPVYVESKVPFHGREAWLDTSLVPLAVKAGEVTAVMGVSRDITKRKRAEEELRSANEALRIYARVTENSPDLISVVDRQYIYRMVNPSYTRMHALPADKIVGHSVGQIHGEDVFQSLIRPNLDRCFAGQPVVYEAWFTYAGVGPRYAEVHYYPLFNNEQVEYAVVVVRDITERKRAETERERMIAILETTPDFVGIADAGGHVLYLNGAARRMLGIGEGQSISGRRVSDNHPRWATELILGEAFPTAAREGCWMGQTAVLNCYGREIPVSMVILAHAGPKGTVEVFSTISRDITESLRAHQERERILAELDVTISSIADAVLILGPGGRIIRVNPASENILGSTMQDRDLPVSSLPALVSAETAEGKPFPGEALPPLRALRGETVRGVVMIIHRPPGGTIWTSVSAAPICLPDGQLLGSVAIFTDITALHEFQEQHEDLLRAVSHDLRMPLTIIQVQVQLLQRLLERADFDDRARRSTEAITTGAQRMNAMIQDLVDAARLEARQLPLEKRPLHFDSFITDLLERAKGVLEPGRVRLEIPEGLPPVEADPSRLERILLNLLGNALQYSAPGTEVLVRAVRTNQELTVSVSDTGAGISPEDLQHLFERFYRAKGARKGEGLGLGLYITRMLVEAHGGRISVESEPEKGSTFHFSLPLG